MILAILMMLKSFFSWFTWIFKLLLFVFVWVELRMDHHLVGFSMRKRLYAGLCVTACTTLLLPLRERSCNHTFTNLYIMFPWASVSKKQKNGNSVIVKKKKLLMPLSTTLLLYRRMSNSVGKSKSVENIHINTHILRYIRFYSRAPLLPHETYT